MNNFYEPRDSIYCYPNSNVLVNKFDVRVADELFKIENDITIYKLFILRQKGITGNFDVAHFVSIHKFIFEDLYDWAGIIRTVNISKKGTQFAKADNINSLANACFMRLKNQNYFKNLNKEDFVLNISDFYCVTNYLHPFREGNGRTQRVFLSQLSYNAGYEMNFADIDTDELMIATIHAANGVNTHLRAVLYDIITPIDK